jgi:proteasome lid subunit RPN8/RPN11
MTLEISSIHEAMKEVAEVLKSSLTEICIHFREDLPNECVGLVWEDGEIQRLRNQASSPNRFSVSLPQLAERLAEREGTVIAIYHSHPGGSSVMSSADKKSLSEQFDRGLPVPWLIVTEEDACLWYIADDIYHWYWVSGGDGLWRNS